MVSNNCTFTFLKSNVDIARPAPQKFKLCRNFIGPPAITATVWYVQMMENMTPNDSS